MEVALFPLAGMIHLPGTNRPLNIFEPRYIAMVEAALKDGSYIALCQGAQQLAPSEAWLPIEHESYKSVGRICGAGLPILLARESNGNLLIMLTGEFTLELEAVIPSETPYLKARAQVRSENRLLKPEGQFMYQRMRSLLIQKIEKLASHPLESERIKQELHSPTRLVAYFAEFMLPRPEVKERLLAMTDVNEKITYLAEFYLNEARSQQLQ